ncbi:unnamed protein product [Rotaria magnacalcarata]|uniref:UBC core domain-containing protein n=1 Tax=Rotaria magnacalcarata TaxID=392030 RepID=A0A814MUF8_9BILA|nr:unnamed protein product [Rotaria magnacalcarata]CAF1639160.1 unnamed protein product [Rotaria magnacalcarata]CAF1938935.1 unnamed protein product [Rotaria magnacalcarata]CAF2032149.1 unnamed protein product [Rotaria magnacalcarata]CAF3800683.1 unnamed protein product [Rotaria magnacalcarata]
MEKNEYALDYILQAEYNLLRKQFIPGIIVIPSGKSNLIWNGVHFISQGPYEGGVFRFSILIPNTFPDGDCPQVYFSPSVYHPQMSAQTGELDIKRYFPVWKRNGHHLWQVLRYIRRIFQKIEITNAINLDAAQLYEHDPGAFLLKVSECVNQSKDNIYIPDSLTSDDPHAIVFTPWNERLQMVQQHLLAGTKQAFDNIQGLSWMKPGVYQILTREDTLTSHQN